MLWKKKVINWRPTTVMVDKARVKLYNQFYSKNEALYKRCKRIYFQKQTVYVEAEFSKLKYNQKSLEKFLK